MLGSPYSDHFPLAIENWHAPTAVRPQSMEPVLLPSPIHTLHARDIFHPAHPAHLAHPLLPFICTALRLRPNPTTGQLPAEPAAP
jgi:hypothetical protein